MLRFERVACGVAGERRQTERRQIEPEMIPPQTLRGHRRTMEAIARRSEFGRQIAVDLKPNADLDQGWCGAGHEHFLLRLGS